MMNLQLLAFLLKWTNDSDIQTISKFFSCSVIPFHMIPKILLIAFFTANYFGCFEYWVTVVVSYLLVPRHIKRFALPSYFQGFLGYLWFYDVAITKNLSQSPGSS